MRVKTRRILTHKERDDEWIKSRTCFWCDHQGDMTRDHLISNPLCVYLGANLRHKWVKACAKCNKSRGEITVAFASVLQVRRDLARGPKVEMLGMIWDVGPELKRMERNWWKRRANVMPLAILFRDRIRHKLESTWAALCMIELREIGCPET